MDKENFTNTKVVLDARSITQLLYMLSYVNANTTLTDVTILWIGRPELIKSIKKYLHLPEVINMSNANISDSNILFNYFLLFKISGKIPPINKKIVLFTAFNHGLYFSMLKSKLSLSPGSIYLFDDGSINIIQKYNSKRVLRFILYALHGLPIEWSKYRLFCNKKYNKIYTVLSKDVIPECAKEKKIVNISGYVSSLYSLLFKKIYKGKIRINSALLLTHHAVESRRLSIGEYQDLIVSVVNKIKFYGVENIYLSTHHLEGDINKEFYKSLELILIHEDFPAELFLSSEKISIIAQPYNSTPLIANFIGLLSNINTIISYKVVNSPDINSRISSIKNMTIKNNITHCEL